jgi:hypothetical protein
MPTFVSRDALDQLLLERYGGKVGRGLAVELWNVPQFPDVRHLYLLCPSSISERTVRLVKFRRNRANIQGGTCVCCRRPC